MLSEICLNLDQSKSLSSGKELTFLQWKSFKNTEGKGEIARYEQFLLFHSVFYWSGELSAIFIKFKIVVYKLFQFGRVYNFSFGKGLTTKQM